MKIAINFVRKLIFHLLMLVLLCLTSYKAYLFLFLKEQMILAKDEDSGDVFAFYEIILNDEGFDKLMETTIKKHNHHYIFAEIILYVRKTNKCYYYEYFKFKYLETLKLKQDSIWVVKNYFGREYINGTPIQKTNSRHFIEEMKELINECKLK